MKWTTETRYQGDAELGAWQNDHCTNNRLPYVCSHEQEDVSDQIIDNIVQTPYVAPDLMNSNNLHIEIDGNGKMDMA